MQMPQIPLPSNPVPSHIPRADLPRIGPETNPQTKLELMANPVSGDVDVSSMNPIMNAFMNQELRKPTAMFDAPAFGTLDDVARKMGKPAGSFSSELKRIYDQWGGHYNLSLKDKSRGYTNPDDSIGYIEMGAQPIEGHLPITMTYLGDSYHDKGLGGEMYREAIEKVKEKGFRGLASDPDFRNDFSNQIWDRPGITSIDQPGGYKYELMSEYIPRGKDWQSSGLKNLFQLDKTEQPMLPGVKDYLLEQMRNRSIKPASLPPVQSLPGEFRSQYEPPLFQFFDQIKPRR